ncbi:MAG: PfkB family carbohydrate kinase [Candidatus Omnitrophica bacterium]|nr:PfkB family carbohydrate kinase [Candidatus Omnitrophota bacterium]
MKKMDRVISTLVLVAFLFNTAVSDYAFAQTLPNTDKLAPASMFDDLLGRIDLQDISRIEKTLTGLALLAKKGDGTIDIEKLTEIVNRSSDSLFKSPVRLGEKLRFYPNEATALPNGCWRVMARINDLHNFSGHGLREYYVVIPGRADELGGFPARACTKIEWPGIEKAIRAGLPVPDRAAERPEDAEAIRRYKEINEEKISAFIRERLHAGDFAEIDGRAKSLGWNDKYPNRISPDAKNTKAVYWASAVESMFRHHSRGFFDVFGIDFDEVFGKKNFVFIKIPKGMEDRLDIEEGGEKIGVRARTSNNTIYFFVEEDDFNDIGRLSASHDFPGMQRIIISSMLVDFIHETGAACGLPFSVLQGGLVIHKLDDAYADYKSALREKGSEPIDTIKKRITDAYPGLVGLRSVDLDILRGINSAGELYDRDYEAGRAPGAVEDLMPGGKMVIDNNIEMTYVGMVRGKAKLGFRAPQEVDIYLREIYEDKTQKERIDRVKVVNKEGGNLILSGFSGQEFVVIIGDREIARVTASYGQGSRKVQVAIKTADGIPVRSGGFAAQPAVNIVPDNGGNRFVPVVHRYEDGNRTSPDSDRDMGQGTVEYRPSDEVMKAFENSFGHRLSNPLKALAIEIWETVSGGFRRLLSAVGLLPRTVEKPKDWPGPWDVADRVKYLRLFGESNNYDLMNVLISDLSMRQILEFLRLRNNYFEDERARFMNGLLEFFGIIESSIASGAVKKAAHARVAAERKAVLDEASLVDLRRNRADDPENVAFVGIMCTDRIHAAKEMLPGMESDTLSLAGAIEGSIDPDGSKTEEYIAALPSNVRADISDPTKVISGGPATSSTRVCAQLAGRGIRASLVTSVGEDGAPLVRAHKAVGVDMTNVMVSGTKPTAKTLVFELGEGTRSFLHDIGASAELTIDTLRPEYFRGRKIVEFGGIELSGLMPDLDRALEMAKKEGCITVLDTVVDRPHQWKAFRKRYGGEYLKRILSLVDVFAPSYGEALQIYADYVHPDDQEAAALLEKKVKSGKDKSPEELAAFFASHGARAVFLKNGTDGVYAHVSPRSVFSEVKYITRFHIPILRGFEPVSGTGTGDAFVGALVYALAKDWPARKAAMFADVVGGMCVQHNGGTIEEESLVDALYHMECLEAQMRADSIAAQEAELLSRIDISDSDDEMGSRAAAAILADIRRSIAENGFARILFASAPSQHSTWKHLIRLWEELPKAEQEYLADRVIAFHMDEYIGLPEGAGQLFGKVLKERLFDVLGIKRVHYFNSRIAYDTACALREAIDKEDDERAEELAAKLESETAVHAANLERIFNNYGGRFDVVIGGIGKLPHLAFNDPPAAKFHDPQIVKVVRLTETSRQQQVDDKEFKKRSDVPTHALTFSLRPILDANSIYIMVPQGFKARAVRDSLDGEVSEAAPASGLRLPHVLPHARVYLTKEAAALSETAHEAMRAQEIPDDSFRRYVESNVNNIPELAASVESYPESERPVIWDRIQFVLRDLAESAIRGADKRLVETATAVLNDQDMRGFYYSVHYPEVGRLRGNAKLYLSIL